MTDEKDPDIETKQDFEEKRAETETPGKLPGEDSAPTQQDPMEPKAPNPDDDIVDVPATPVEE